MDWRISSEFSRQAEHMTSAPAFHAQAVLQRLLKAIGEAPSDRVLDLACGPGIVAQALASQARQIVGIDVTPAMIGLARQRFVSSQITTGQFCVALAEKLPFTSSFFDQVVTRLSVHHFQDSSAVLSEVKRVMVGGGRLIIADVVSSENEEESALHNALEQLRDPTHVRMLAIPEILELLHSAGFEVLQRDAWRQPRAFSEWAEIIADPGRTAPLEAVMRALARTGQSAGIGLREDFGRLVFEHTWTMIVATVT
jgi:ubiquinone/menaquinone biosynthesis C-methylase UbiE